MVGTTEKPAAGGFGSSSGCSYSESYQPSRILHSSHQSILCPNILQYLQYSGLYLRGAHVSAHCSVCNNLFLPSPALLQLQTFPITYNILMGNGSWSLSMAILKAGRLLSLSSPSQLDPTATVYLPLPHRTTSPVMGHAPSIPDKSHPSSFNGLLDAALRDYEKQTGTKLPNHPFAKRLKKCDTVDSMASVLQDHAQAFLKFRGEGGKIMKTLKSTTQVLSTLSDAVLGEGVGLVRPEYFIPNFLLDEHFVGVSSCKGYFCRFWSLA